MTARANREHTTQRNNRQYSLQAKARIDSPERGWNFDQDLYKFHGFIHLGVYYGNFGGREPFKAAY
jgi:hypothetical protein